MATSKTLTPTNVTIQIPAFTDQPDQRVNSNCIDKEADAINALNTAIVALTPIASKSFGSVDELNSYGNSVINSVTFTSTGTARSNLPFASDGTMIINGTGNYMHVTVYRANGECYTRHRNNGAWDTDWQQIAVSTNMGNYSVQSGSTAWGTAIEISRNSIHYHVRVTAGREGYGFILYVPKSTNEKIILCNVGNAYASASITNTSIKITTASSGYGTTISWVAEIWY